MANTHLFVLAGIIASAAQSPVQGTVTAATGTRPAPACEAFIDEREIRYRAPARTVRGRIRPESVVIDPIPPVEFGQTLVLGGATLETAGGETIAVTFGYWQTRDACGGWEPARGAAMTFDLADDKAANGALRVMRAGEFAGTR